jgi:hypothetical protein
LTRIQLAHLVLHSLNAALVLVSAHRRDGRELVMPADDRINVRTSLRAMAEDVQPCPRSRRSSRRKRGR